MGSRRIAFPSHLREHIDSLVSSAQAAVREPPRPAFDLVTSWCEVHPDESHIEDGESGRAFVVVPVNTLPSGCTDNDIELDEALPPGLMSDRRRVELMRERLHELLEGTTDEAQQHPLACFLRIRGSSGESAILGYLWSGGGYGTEPEVEWLGVYRSAREWKADLRGRGYLTSATDVDRLSDSHLLDVWKQTNTDRE